MRIAAKFAAFGLGACVAAAAFPQGYPTKPVRIIVPFTAGSGVDVVARMMAPKLSEAWSQSVTVENHVGAGGTIGAGLVAKSPPDGYTLLINTTAHAVNAALYTNLAYDPLKDFIAVSPLVAQPYVLVADPSANVKTVSDLITAARAKPGQLKFGSAGTGSGTHMVAEKFKLAANIDVVHVPNKGGPEANADATSGRVTYWFPPIALALPQVREGKLVALGVSSARRSSLLPDVPAIAEAGVGGFEDTIWYGVWAPAGTPSDVVDKTSKDVARALATPDVRDRLSKLGAEPMNMTPVEFARFVRNEVESAGQVLKAAGIKPQ
jgi:tripartite-type tricarboxylate transporter receptor subunit TctC